MLTSKIPLRSSAALKILNSLKILWSLMSEAGFFHEKSSWNRHERDPHAHPWKHQWKSPMVSIPSMNILIWLVVGPPLWKIWVRQLGWWDSQVIWENKTCSKPPTSHWICLNLQVLPFFITEQRCGFPEGGATDRLEDRWEVQEVSCGIPACLVYSMRNPNEK